MITLLNAFSIAVGVGLVWLPQVWHYWVPTREPSRHEILNLRAKPEGDIVAAVAAMSLAGVDIPQQPTDIALRGEAALRGRLLVHGSAIATFDPRFDLRDFENAGSASQLHLAGLLNVDYLLQAYEATRREEFFQSAKEYLLQFADAERRLWLPRGFVWNDHAIAARVPVLARFWGIYRQRPDFDEAEARHLLVLVLRSGCLLASSGHFTVATNHGVMQNIGLLQLSTAFPGLREAQEWSEVARARLAEQLQFYVDREGVVLEHSAGYHRYGVRLLAMAIRLLEINAVKVPPEWVSKLSAARRFLATLRRPDNSLPTFGDTDFLDRVEAEDFGPVCSETPGCLASIRPAEQVSALYPGAGYAIWWSGLEDWPRVDKLSQTVILWSHYKGHGHELADEMSTLLWSRGRQWVTNVGYWPDAKGRDEASGWKNGNGPHLLGEPARSNRETSLRYFALTHTLQVVDLERTLRTPGIRLRRQILAIDGKLWLVLDSSEGSSPSMLETIWTFGPSLSLHRQGNSAMLKANDAPRAMLVSIVGSGGLQTVDHRGSLDPFAGWVVQDSQPTPAPALVVREGVPGGWTLTTFALSDDPQLPGPPRLPDAGLISAEQWHATLKLPTGDVRVARSGTLIEVTYSNGSRSTLTLSLGTSLTTDRQEVDEAFAIANAKYPKFRDLFYYRVRATGLIALGILLQEAILFLVRRRSREGALALRLLAAPAWLGLAALLGLLYLT